MLRETYSFLLRSFVYSRTPESDRGSMPDGGLTPRQSMPPTPRFTYATVIADAEPHSEGDWNDFIATAVSSIKLRLGVTQTLLHVFILKLKLFLFVQFTYEWQRFLGRLRPYQGEHFRQTPA